MGQKQDAWICALNWSGSGLDKTAWYFVHCDSIIAEHLVIS
jgi:hypothetical protein